MKIGFTGTHKGMTDQQQFKLSLLLAHLDVSELHHGDCIGADAEAHALAIEMGIHVVIHPPDNDAKRAFCLPGLMDITILPSKPYLARNRDIVEACDVLIAAPKENREQLRSGTWATVRYARQAKKQIVLLDHPSISHTGKGFNHETTT